MTPRAPKPGSAAQAVCSRCQQLQPASEFYAHPKSTTGLQSRCKPCLREIYAERREAFIEYTRNRRWMDARVRMASDARRRDRASGRESDIRAKDIRIPRDCPVTGKPILHGYLERMPWSPCLERLDKSKGYVRGNWRVVSWEAAKLRPLEN